MADDRQPAGYPQSIVPVDHVEPVPRRIRAVLGDEVVLDTTRALYLWEWPNYPQYYVPLADVRADVLVDEDHTQHLKRGTARRHGLRVGSVVRAEAARVYTESSVPGLTDTVRFEWDALDAWFEEDEQVFVHPRNPYTRIDALRSTRSVRIELEGVVLADAVSSVLLFETGLPTRYYLDRSALHLEHLVASDTTSACPYKGRTSGYWSARIGDAIHADIAWVYDFPTRESLAIAGLVAFYNEHVDVFLDGQLLDRPQTVFSK